MSMNWNVFRILADVSHTAAVCILIYAIHSNRSAEGVSLLTQSFYLVVFLARYLPFPLFYGASGFHAVWNLTLKIFYILSAAWIIFIMMRVYARTREKEKAYKIGGVSFVGSLVLAPFVMLIFTDKASWSFAEFLWNFSIVLESICVLPQLLLLRQTTVPTVLDSFYLVTLGSYRGFYLLNWLVRAIGESYLDPASMIFGLIQTLLYLDFAWVYWTRQRVKLRGGAVVDSDDLSKGWLVKRLIGRRGSSHEDEEAVPAAGNYNHHDGATDRPRPKTTNSWGPRGISVSADDGVHEVEAQRGAGVGELTDPSRFEDEDSDEDAVEVRMPGQGPPAFADDEEDNDPTLPHHRAVAGADTGVDGVSGGAEWRDGR